MRRAALPAALFLVTAGPAAAEDLQFALINASSSSVIGFSVSRAGADDWGDNLVEGGILPAGSKVDVTIPDGRPACDYDLRVTFADGSEAEDYAVNLCER